MTASSYSVPRWSPLADLPPWWQLLPFLVVTGLLMWWLGRRLKLPTEAWLAVWGFFLVFGLVDLHRHGAMGLWLILGALPGIYGAGWIVARRNLPA